MNKRSTIVVAIGILMVIVGAIADYVGLGTYDSFGWLQIAFVVVGAIVALTGFVLGRGAAG